MRSSDTNSNRTMKGGHDLVSARRLVGTVHLVDPRVNVVLAMQVLARTSQQIDTRKVLQSRPDRLIRDTWMPRRS